MSLWNSMAQTNIKDTYADISQIAVKKTIASQVICDAETRESEKENEKLFRCSFCEAISDGCWQTLPHLVWSVFTFFFFISYSAGTQTLTLAYLQEPSPWKWTLHFTMLTVILYLNWMSFHSLSLSPSRFISGLCSFLRWLPISICQNKINNIWNEFPMRYIWK